ncbi:hypothetical protein CPB86DRAFT_689595, partial [Serendipita vermifera]
VLYVPKLRSNLISVTYLTKYRGLEVNFKGTTVNFIKANKLMFTASMSTGNLPILDGTTLPIESANSAITSRVPVSMETWHNRFAHRHYPLLQKL